ncbi:MAG: cation-translocating P-type ATPase [Euryarchaeota archaeon]|nr:cation-translocating P-type ATPase [Euryarchaeota archaeon]
MNSTQEPFLNKFFRVADSAILTISPKKDPLLLRTLVAFGAVIFFILDIFTDFAVIYAAGIITYLFCLLLYAEGLGKALFLMHKVSAELLIVLVMVVTLLDGEPLSGALVAWFIGLGLFISFTIIRKNREKIEALIREEKRTARVLEENTIKDVRIEYVRAGDIVLVPKGEIVPVDGIITEGKSSFDESIITGEPFPVVKQAGDEVTSGSINLGNPTYLRAVADGDCSFISLITSEIEESLKNKSGLQKQADTAVQVLLIGVTAYSFLLYAVTGSLNLMATALTIVCPCAWALATPTAFASAIGRLASKQILVRNGEPLETLNQADVMVFDKTGTITKGEPEVKRIIPLAMPEQDLLEIAASVESRFNHPIAQSIVQYARDQGTLTEKEKTVSETIDIPGFGVQSLVDGEEVIIGSQETMESKGLIIPNVVYEGRAVWVAVNDELMGAIIIRDTTSAEMEHLADNVRSYGISDVILATGDGEEREAKRIAGIIGADEYYYNCKPDDKTALIQKLGAEKCVVMVGDGANDAPSLAAAHVGIAISGHKNVNLAIKSSDVIILGDDAGDVLTILKTAGKMGRIIRENYAWAISFNVIGLLLVTLGLLNPILAAILHHISSVFVVSNAARIYFGKD